MTTNEIKANLYDLQVKQRRLRDRAYGISGNFSLASTAKFSPQKRQEQIDRMNSAWAEADALTSEIEALKEAWEEQFRKEFTELCARDGLNDGSSESHETINRLCNADVGGDD